MPTPRFIGHEIYRTSTYGLRHPLAIPRVSTVMDLSRALGWLDQGNFIRSPRARKEALIAWHTPEYVDALVQAEAAQAVTAQVTRRHGLGTLSNPVFGEMFRRPATSAGGVILAGALLAGGGVVFSPAGGTHHGFPDHAGGFCYLNDPMLGLLSLRAHGVRRIAYVDLDAHHPDGVEHGVRNDTDTLLISVHEERRWPGTGRLESRGIGNLWNLPVPRDFSDDEMSAVLNDFILPRVAAFRPDALILQCGADAIREDPLSRLSLSNRALLDAVEALLPLAPRALVLGGGGYNPWSVARFWTAIWGRILGAALPDPLPEPAVAVLKALQTMKMPRRYEVEDHWITTLLDQPRPGPIRDEVRARISALNAQSQGWI